MIADSSYWLQVTDNGIWIWHPHIQAIPRTQENIRQLTSEGWQEVDRIRHPAVAEVLQGQLAPIRATVNRKNEIDIWAHPDDIAYALSVPVVLGFPVPSEILEHRQGNQLHYAQVLPPQWLGIYGLVVTDATTGGWTVTIYHSSANDDDLMQEREQLRVAILKLAGAAGWVPASDTLTRLMEPGGYEEGSRHLASHTSDPEAQAALDALFLAAEPIRQQREHIISDPQEWEKEWETIHTMANNLAASYWRVHKQATKVRTLPLTANVFEIGHARIPSLMPIYQIAQAQAQGGKGWTEVENVPTFHHKTDQHETYLQARTRDETQQAQDDSRVLVDDTTVNKLWEHVNKMNDLDSDVFLILLAQQMARPADNPDGSLWITAEQILKYRDLQPITKRDGGQVRRAGDRTEDIINVGQCIARATALWVELRSWLELPFVSKRKAKRRLYTHSSRLLNVSEVITLRETLPVEQREGAGSYAVAWRYRLGTWLDGLIEGPNRKMALLAQQVLQYDYYHQMWEKRLARYFMFHLRINAKTGGNSIVRRIGALIEELVLPIDERNPQRTRDRFEQAMNTLVKDAQIASWEYEQGKREALPPRRWLPAWLDRRVRVHTAPLLREEYASIAAHSPKRTRDTVLEDLRRGGEEEGE